MTATVRARPQPREIIEHTIQRLLDEAQRLIWELDDSDGDPDLEPSLGSVAASQRADQQDWAEGAADEREDQCEGEGEQDEREPDPSDDALLYHPEDQRRIVSGG